MDKYLKTFKGFKLIPFIMSTIFILAKIKSFFNNYFCKNKSVYVVFVSLQALYVITNVITNVITSSIINNK